MNDVRECLDETGVEGVLSAETLLENPALFAGFRTAEWAEGSEATDNKKRCPVPCKLNVCGVSDIQDSSGGEVFPRLTRSAEAVRLSDADNA